MKLLGSDRYVSRQELMDETGVCNAKLAKCVRNLGLYNRPIPRERKPEIVEYIKRCIKTPEESLVRTPKTAVHRKKTQKQAVHDWRVSLLGTSGWIVVRCGTKEDMTAWAELLQREGIEARASVNSYGSIENEGQEKD